MWLDNSYNYPKDKKEDEKPKYKNTESLLKDVFWEKLSAKKFGTELDNNPILKQNLVTRIQNDELLLKQFIQKKDFLWYITSDITNSSPDFFLKKIALFKGGNDIVRSNLLDSIYSLIDPLIKNPDLYSIDMSTAIRDIFQNFSSFDSKEEIRSLQDGLFKIIGSMLKSTKIDEESALKLINNLDTKQFNTFIANYSWYWEMKLIFLNQFPWILNHPWIDKKSVISAHWQAFHDLSKISPYLDDSYVNPESIQNGLITNILYFAKKNYPEYDNFRNEIQKINTLSQEKKDLILRIAAEQYAQGIKSKALPGQNPLRDENGNTGSNMEWWEDIALKIKPDWIVLSSWKELTLDQKQRYIVFIARNFSFEWKTEKDINKESVENMLNTIEQSREIYGNQQIFSQRNVLFMANGEITNKKVQKKFGIVNRFGRESTQDAIRLQSWSYTFIRPENSKEWEEKAKLQILEQIIKTPPPFTFIFDGHGEPDILFLSGRNSVNGKIDEKNIVGISVEELVNAYSERIKKWWSGGTDSNMELKDIFVFGACYSANFSKKFLSKLDILPKPIIVWESEYNQKWINFDNNKFGGNFMENILNLKFGNPTSIWDIIRWASEQKSDQRINSSSYIFIPTDKKTLQISAIEMDFNRFT